MYSIAVHHPPAASVSFTAHNGLPILLLEDLDYLFESVLCSENVNNHIPGTMDLRFASADAFEEALDTWTDSGTFIVVTSHPSCNIANERGAWT